MRNIQTCSLNDSSLVRPLRITIGTGILITVHICVAVICLMLPSINSIFHDANIYLAIGALLPCILLIGTYRGNMLAFFLSTIWAVLLCIAGITMKSALIINPKFYPNLHLQHVIFPLMIYIIFFGRMFLGKKSKEWIAQCNAPKIVTHELLESNINNKQATTKQNAGGFNSWCRTSKLGRFILGVIDLFSIHQK